MRQPLVRVLVMFVVLAAAAHPADVLAQERETAREAGDHALEITVLHRETKEAMPDAEVRVAKDDQELLRLKPDAQGRVRIPIEKGVKDVRISGRKDGFAPLGVKWRVDDPQHPLPAHHTLLLEPAKRVGGIVQDAQGKPIADATVTLSVFGKGYQAQEWMGLCGFHVKTGADGRWKADVLPEELKAVVMMVSHPDYVGVGEARMLSEETIDQLKGEKHAVSMKRGFGLRGTVVDRNGTPIAGARVSQGASRFEAENLPQTKTDELGRFNFPATNPGPVVVTVESDKHAPEVREVVLAADGLAVDFKLAPGGTIRGRAVDVHGKPVPKAWVVVDEWRKYRNLRWQTHTDEQGRFEWNGAPPDPVQIDVLKQGMMAVRDLKLVPREQEYVITVPPELVIKGTVVDAISGKPVERFTFLRGIVLEGGDDEPFWPKDEQRHASDGKFQLVLVDAYYGHLVKVEADGYEPFVSRMYRPTDGEQLLNVKLKQAGSGPGGIVLTPDGKPAAGAELILYSRKLHARFENGKPARGYSNEPAPVVKTDKDGSFAFNTHPEPFGIYVQHEAGFAAVKAGEFRDGMELKLSPWATVEGRVMIGSKPGAGENVRASAFDFTRGGGGRLELSWTAQTDADGRFRIERVRGGGEVSVGRFVRYADETGRWSTETSTHARRMKLESGETAQVQIGGSGRAVVGRLVMPGDIDPSTYRYRPGHVSLKQPEWKQPDDWEQLTQEQKSAAWAEHRKTPAYQAYENGVQHLYLDVQKDGRFRIDDVPAGTYALSVEALRVGQGAGRFENAGRASREFIVPEMPGGRSDDPLDLGDVPVTAIRRINVGDDAPALDVTSLDGKPIRLADQRGKFVLLDFWTSGYVRSTEQTAPLKTLYERMSKDERFVMIGLAMEDAKSASAFVQKEAIPWPNAAVGYPHASEIPPRWGLEGNRAHTIFLIGPDGKVLAKDLSENDAADAVTRALAQ